MGTSTSANGPGDRTPKLPSSAFPSDDSPSAGNEDSPPSRGEQQSDFPDSDNEADTSVSENETQTYYWQSARSALTASIKGGGKSGGGKGFSSPCKKYIRALGGAKKASKTSNIARKTTARLGSFLAGVASKGIESALKELGLGELAGEDIHTVFTAIIDALAPEGATIEESSARDGISEAFVELFESQVGADGDMTALENMAPDTIHSAIETSVATSIFYRWLGDLSKQLERNAITPSEAVKLENEMKSYIRDTVKLDFRNMDPLKMDWNGKEGKEFMERIYDEAYKILSEST